MRAHNPKYAISRLTAEFIDPAIEQAYRKHVELETARFLSLAVRVWVFLVLVFALTDWLALGFSNGFYTLLGIRLYHAALLLGLDFFLRSRPHWATNGWPITLVSIAGYPLFIVYPVIIPDTESFGLAVMLMMLLSMYVFVPNRVPLINLVAAAGMLVVLGSMLRTGEEPALILLVFFTLIWPVALGFIAALRINTGNRLAYALLVSAEESNTLLEQEISQRKKLEAELQRQALTDPLTGLSNRRQYEMLFNRELERCRRHGSNLVLGMIDLDHFKKINDQYGHEFGDQVLCTLSEVLLTPLRQSDILGRFGGEEFILILPDTTLEQGTAIAERMRQALQSATIIKDGKAVQMTATFALTAITADDTEIKQIINRADAALYAGKREGRNRVMTAQAA